MNLSWYLYRLRFASPGEVAVRLARLARDGLQAALAASLGVNLLERRAARAARALELAPLFATPGELLPGVLAPRPRQKWPTLKRAEEIAQGILGGSYNFFGREVKLGHPPPWRRDWETDFEWPLRHGLFLTLQKNPGPGEPRRVWELGRLHHVVTLARAAYASADPRFFHEAIAQLRHFQEANPAGYGIQWIDALEAGQRIVAVVFAAAILAPAGVIPPDDRRLLAALIHAHADFIADHHALPSSQGNHCIGEAAGLLIAAAALADAPRARVWQERGKATLLAQLERQVLPDGAGFEQTVGYLLQVVEWYLLALTVKAWTPAEREKIIARVGKALDFLLTIRDAGGGYPDVGDNDNGLPIPLDLEPGDDRILSLARTFVALQEPQPESPDERVFWLTGRSGEPVPENSAAADPFLRRVFPSSLAPRIFPEGGWAVLGWDFGEATEVKLVLRAGPLSFHPRATHAHADALSFTLSVAGRPVLVDAGTGLYFAEPRLRQYFTGTRAHNTMRIGGRDQAEARGPGKWAKLFLARIEAADLESDPQSVKAGHDGYQRLSPPARHLRVIRLDRGAQRLTIEDTVETEGSWPVELFFHFHPAHTIIKNSGEFMVAGQNGRFRLQVDEKLDARLASSDADPERGWFSPVFNRLQPAPVIIAAGRVQGPASFRTVLEFPR